MAKGRQSGRVLNIVVWITGVLVSLAVGFGMADGTLAIRWIPNVITQIAGWIVVVATVVSAVLAILNQ